MEQSNLLLEANSRSDRQDIHWFVWNLEILYRIRTRAHHWSIRLIHFTSTYPIFFKVHFNIILPYATNLPSSLFPSGFRTKILYAFLQIEN
jgi:hypothetical protein